MVIVMMVNAVNETASGTFPELLAALQGNRVASYCILASYVMLLYDHCLTMGKEIEYIWPTSWSLGKSLYFVTKYFALIDGAMDCYTRFAPPKTPPTTCAMLSKVSGGLIIWGMLIAELVLLFRTWAIWGKDSKLAIALLCILCIMAIPTAFFAYFGLAAVQFSPSPTRLITCWKSAHSGKILVWDYIIVIVFETIILVLTMYKGTQHLRQSVSCLVSTLYFDGILYYVYLIGFSLINIIVITKSGRTHGLSLILMQRVLHAIFTSRILLNLREAASRDRAQRTRARGETKDIVLTRGASVSHESRTGTALSSVILGVDMWFLDTEDGHAIQGNVPVVMI